MLFNSLIFLFLFLPIVLILYYTIGHKNIKIKNTLLLIASLFFYAWGEPIAVLILLSSIIINYTLAILVDKYRDSKYIKLILFTTGFINIFILFIFKYLLFTLNVIQNIFNTNILIPKIALPIGISFFTFQALSYVIDVYRQKGTVQKNILGVALYISFFPQLIAGPIVRYETFYDQIYNRTESFELFREGVIRFCFGLAKKTILANNMAIIADVVFNGGNVSVLANWIGIICYALQIYYDFSGYSDMAIGLGKMFGFNFLENFNYPYIANSITDFWRRWHISLSSWFRDYVYIPLGGSRCNSKLRVIFNLFVVWLLTGIWHGANWTFLIWGLWYFVFLILEKFTPFGKLINKSKVFSRIYTLLVVLLGWVFFRSDNISFAFNYISGMFNFTSTLVNEEIVVLLKQYSIIFALSLVVCMPLKQIFRIDQITNIKAKNCLYVATDLICISLLIMCCMFIASGSYNPFIYFNF